MTKIHDVPTKDPVPESDTLPAQPTVEQASTMQLEAAGFRLLMQIQQLQNALNQITAELAKRENAKQPAPEPK